MSTAKTSIGARTSKWLPTPAPRTESTFVRKRRNRVAVMAAGGLAGPPQGGSVKTAATGFRPGGSSTGFCRMWRLVEVVAALTHAVRGRVSFD